MTVRTLVVDDSPTMRAMVSHVLSTDGEIEVVGTAGSPTAARALIKQLDPDVVTLDVEMPDMNGLDFLDKIMRLRPMPVVMLSSLTQRGAETTLRALELGAFDCFGKPTVGLHKAPSYCAELTDMVKAAARSNCRRRAAETRRAPISQTADHYRPRADALITIGASTGGVEALIELLADFPAACPPTLIVQHMPESFTTTFAARLDRLSRPTVREARHGEALLTGHVYLAPGGLRHLEIGGTRAWHCRLIEGERSSGHRPSVDRLFHSVASRAGKAAVGAILTGMGADGAAGLKAMRDAGATTLGQDRESCVVYGMPAAAQEIGAVTAQLPLSRMAARLLAECAA
jgi:two-component system chemotaxis response regulator CheB